MRRLMCLFKRHVRHRSAKGGRGGPTWDARRAAAKLAAALVRSRTHGENGGFRIALWRAIVFMPESERPAHVNHLRELRHERCTPQSQPDRPRVIALLAHLREPRSLLPERLMAHCRFSRASRSQVAGPA